MNYIILISILFTATIQGIFAKEYFVKAKNSSPMLFSLLSVVFALCYFAVAGIGSLDFSNILAYLPYSLCFAIAYGSATYGSKAAVKHGPLALGTLFNACSILIPTFLGIIFLGDEMLPPQRIFGLVILILSICIANLKKEDARITPLWVLFIVISLIGNGFCSFTQAAQVKFQSGQYGNEFMITSLFIVSFALAISYFSTVKKDSIKVQVAEPRLWIYSILAGLANGFTNKMVMVLVNRNLPQSVIQPTVSAGGLLLTLIAAVVLYKEKQSRAKIFSFVLGAISLILLNI